MIFTYVATARKEEGMRGYFLSVSNKGIPVDFKYTEPVRVDNIRKHLYGDTLDKHIRLSVIFEKFFQTVDFSIDLVFTEDDIFLDNDIFKDVLSVKTTEEEPLNETGDVRELSENYFLIQHSFSGNPLKVKVRDRSTIEKFSQILHSDTPDTPVHEFDIYEPFKRLHKLVEEI